MNLILLSGDDFMTDDRVLLKGRGFSHVTRVRRVQPGDELSVGLEGGRIGKGTVVRLGDRELELEVCLFRDPPEPLPVTLILALPRPKVFKRLLFALAVMGVKRIVLLNSFKVEKSFWKSPAIEADSVAGQLKRGLEQACDTVIPTVMFRPFFKPFVEDELPELAGETLRIVGHPYVEAPCPRNAGGPVTLAVGPEGGFTDYEVEKLMSVGFMAASLGGRVLNVETAVPYLISRVS